MEFGQQAINRTSVCLSLVLALLGPCLVQAGVVQYSDRDAWMAAAESLDSIRFDQVPHANDPGGVHITDPEGLTLSGVTFVAPSDLSGTGFEIFVSGAQLWAGTVELDISLPPNITAVGA